jgi:hypothetical protein
MYVCMYKGRLIPGSDTYPLPDSLGAHGEQCDQGIDGVAARRAVRETLHWERSDW